MSEIADCLESHRVRVFGPQGESLHLRGMDVIHGELHLTVSPHARQEPHWIVLIQGSDESTMVVGPTLDTVLSRAKLVPGSQVTLSRVVAVSEEQALQQWRSASVFCSLTWLGE